MINIKKFFMARILDGKPTIPATKNFRNSLLYGLKILIYFCLLLLSWGHSGIVRLRTKLYERGIMKQAKLPCPVIGVGNITTGGTGKTPTVIELARILRRHHKKIAILTRGYQRDASIPNIIVRPDSDVRFIGDEPLLMMRKLVERGSAPTERQETPVTRKRGRPPAPPVSIIVGSNRHRSGQIALDRFEPDVFVLDDGFQHLQLARTFDLVLIDATNPFGGNHLLPAGFLREPVRHLRRAHAFLLTRSDEIQDIGPIMDTLRAIHPDAPIFRGIHVYDVVRDISSQMDAPIKTLISKKLLAVSGLGNPDSFHRLLEQCGLQIIQRLDFPDHHWYTDDDIECIRRIMIEHELDGMITTEKDEAKLLPKIKHSETEGYVMAIRMSIQPEMEFEAMLLKSLRAN
ncbi:tetraacyldisaccharide 4'-kinase [candidate division KSB3 bacterium]|uniref:Tetraacyldisaccharide 4'-kinase n=1 Tax=candidate division KSB3 bacterium TaxID=2044937 RepID=A0A2G6KBM0_9BACT|nr:MAG: tetraacyldisaccharide 4'-kinase [candidate division KSB3 bacterium]